MKCWIFRGGRKLGGEEIKESGRKATRAADEEGGEEERDRVRGMAYASIDGSDGAVCKFIAPAAPSNNQTQASSAYRTVMPMP